MAACPPAAHTEALPLPTHPPSHCRCLFWMTRLALPAPRAPARKAYFEHCQISSGLRGKLDHHRPPYGNTMQPRHIAVTAGTRRTHIFMSDRCLCINRSFLLYAAFAHDYAMAC
eukprot:274217-Chlamydomonas_euryale.AAC.3